MLHLRPQTYYCLAPHHLIAQIYDKYTYISLKYTIAHISPRVALFLRFFAVSRHELELASCSGLSEEGPLPSAHSQSQDSLATDRLVELVSHVSDRVLGHVGLCCSQHLWVDGCLWLGVRVLHRTAQDVQDSSMRCYNKTMWQLAPAACPAKRFHSTQHDCFTLLVSTVQCNTAGSLLQVRCGALRLDR